MPLFELENLTLKQRYRIRRLLKKGSYAEVHEAWDLERQRTVVVKALNPSLGRGADAALEEKLIENFRQEVSLLAELRHSGIVELFDEGAEMDRRGAICRYLVLEYLPGGDLQDYCANRPLTMEQTLRYFREICAALELAHSRGIIHRDIKPGNLMFDAGGEKLKLVDFGVAKRLREDRSYEITRVGTDIYAPPEHHPHLDFNPQANPDTGRGKLLPAADIYSLAKTIYAALTGRPPTEFRLHPIDRLPSSLTERKGAETLLAVLRRATADRPADRYALVRDFWRDFVRAAEPALAPPKMEEKNNSPGLRKSGSARFRDWALTRRLSGRRRIVIDLAAQEFSPSPAALPPAAALRFAVNPAQAVLGILLAVIGSILAQAVLGDFPAPVIADGFSVAFGLALAAGGYWLSTRWGKASQPLSTKSLPAFSFTSATVDSRGRTLARKQKQAPHFVERLSSSNVLELVEIPAGGFWMGSVVAEEGHTPGEEPRHRVQVKAFLLGKYPITQAQWRKVAAWPKVRLELNPSPSTFPGDDCPVETVSWHEAMEFCERLAARTGRRYRLPTEAEWEYACRAGTSTPFHFGGTLTPSLANFDGLRPYADAVADTASQRTSPVGAFGVANAFGLFDMHGNVWEWCRDDWHGNYHGAPADGSAWTKGYETGLRVVRGGAWFNAARLCRSAYRYYGAPDTRGNNCGFRVALDLEQI